MWPNSFLALFQSSNLLFISRSSSSESRSLYLFMTSLPSFYKLFLISCLLSLRISIGLHPLQLQNLHPFAGRVARRYILGTWQRQLFPVLLKAFMHSRQQPFFIMNLELSLGNCSMIGSFSTSSQAPYSYSTSSWSVKPAHWASTSFSVSYWLWWWWWWSFWLVCGVSD